MTRPSDTPSEPAEAQLGGFASLDPPEHDRVRRQATWPYGPPHTPGLVAGMEPGIVGLVNGQIDALRGRTRIDIVEDFAYPIPVTVICDLLGVPREDEPRFKVWAEALEAGRDPDAQSPQESRGRDQAAQAIAALTEYIAALIEAIAGSRAPACCPDSSPAMASTGRCPRHTWWTRGACCSSPVTRPR